MFRIVQAQASNGPDMLGRQRGEKHADVGDLVRHLVAAENITADDTSLLGLSNVSRAAWQDGISIVGAAVLGQEPDQSLRSNWLADGGTLVCTGGGSGSATH